MKKQSNLPLIYTVTGIAIIGSLYLGYKSLVKKADINIAVTPAMTATVIIHEAYTNSLGNFVPEGQYSCSDYELKGGCNVGGEFKPSGEYGTYVYRGGAGKIQPPGTSTTTNETSRTATPVVPPANLSVATPVASANPAPGSTDAVAPVASPLFVAPADTTTYKPSDLNKDGKVNIIDYNLFVSEYKK